MKRAAGLLLLAAASPAWAQRPVFTSSVPAIRVTPTETLPRGPAQPLDEYCAGKVVAPRGAAARAVRTRGWHVTGEAPLGRLTAVSFVGGLEPGTSGICLVDSGNVGLFDGARLVAIVHMARGDGAPLRRLTATTVPGRLRLWSEEYSPPLADLVTRGAGAAVEPMLGEERQCGAVVPNVYGLTIQAARRRILAAGWQPVPPSAADIANVSAGRDFDLRREGVTEVEVCSGTGFGLCLFNYRHPRGTRLEIQTAGEESLIVDQRVTCAAPGRRGR